VRRLGELRLAAPARPGGRAYVAAASGLVRHGGSLYVVADDEPTIARFALGREPPRGEPIALEDDELPADPQERKAVKPDLESLCLLPGDTLFALGSGATERRERGWLVPLDGAAPQEVSLAELYGGLRRELADLNVEGAAVADGRLWLAQRGNGHDGENLLVELDLERALAGLDAQRVLPVEAVTGLRRHDLGEIDGVRLTFSDLGPLPDGRLLFCAVAEAGESTYHDGECVGAAVGALALERGGAAVERLERLVEPDKIEGVTVGGFAGDDVELLLVADEDDPDRSAQLLGARLAL
jgi:hypothetical protein